MQRACDIGKNNRLNPVLRKYVLSFAAAFGLVSLVAGFYLGFGIVSHESAIASPIMEKFFLTTFIAISCGAAGMILGAFVGSTIYRVKSKGK